MKSTIHLDALRSIVVEPDANNETVRVYLQTMGITAISQAIDPQQAMMLGEAIAQCGNDVQAAIGRRLRTMGHPAGLVR
jgi:hypothetical protein